MLVHRSENVEREGREYGKELEIVTFSGDYYESYL